MNKKNEIREKLDQLFLIEGYDGTDRPVIVNEILSITNRIKSNDNPFCNNCKETDCEVSHDETCNMIRKYLSVRVKCFDGWIYPDPQKMYEAIKYALSILQTIHDQRIDVVKKDLRQTIGR